MAAAFLSAYLLVLLAGLGLDLLNVVHLRRRGHLVPAELEGHVDDALLQKTAAYNTEHARLGILSSVVGSAATVLFLFTGAVALYDGWIAALTGSFVLGGVLFFLGLTLAETLLSVPFSLWSNFVIEERYGFNRKTAGIWIGDTIKSFVISTLMMSALAAGALAIIEALPGSWWIWVWGFFLLFLLAVMFLAPLFLRLFFRFEPIRGHETLETAVRDMVEGAGLRLCGVYQVDSSRRSTHTNAFFTGLGSSKRIALFDTLLERLGAGEILAVLAHEIGHWKLRHSLRRTAVTAVTSLLALLAAFHLLRWGGLPGLLGLPQASVYVQLVVLALLQTVVTFPLEPLRKALSRRSERQADRFAARLTGRPADLASALAKLSRDNLSNLHPHPLYAAFHYSHPPDAERIAALRSMEEAAAPRDA